MSKFLNRLTSSNDQIKTTRAKRAMTQAKFAQESKIRELTEKKMSLENEIEDITDLGPNSTYSLKPVGDDFNASQWVADLHQKKSALKMVELELEIAQETFNEWFEENEGK